MEVTKANLATYLAGLTPSATPYPIEITETVASDWSNILSVSPIGVIINTNTPSGVYLDLGLTVIPASATTMNRTFYGCISLTTAPAIPSSVTDMSYAFYFCISLTTAPIIPSSVTNMNSTFNNCTSLTTVPIIPSSVTTINSSFLSCILLHTIQNFAVDVDNCDMTNAFFNCPALANIYVTTLTESSWHLLHTDTGATGTDYTIYNPDGTVAGSGTVAGTSQVLSLYGKSDELVISANITPTLAEETATSQVQWHKSGLPYDDELMIFNAKNPTTVISNLLITTLRYSASFTLPTYLDGQKIRIANTHATNTITCTLPTGQTMNGQTSDGQTSFTIIASQVVELELIGTTWIKIGSSGDALPIGTIIATVSDTPDIGYAFCHGQALSRQTYSILFSKIGIKYGVGDGSTTFNLPDCREVSLVGAGTNVSNSAQIEAHNALTVGQFQDDQIEEHAHFERVNNSSGSGTLKGVMPREGSFSSTTVTSNIPTAGVYEGRVSSTTHGKQLGVNYQIKVSN